MTRAVRAAAAAVARRLRRPTSPEPEPARGIRSWLTGRRAAAVGLTVLLVAGVIAGLFGLRVDTQPTAFLPAGDSSLADTEAADRAFGADPIVVLAEAAQPGELLGPEQLPLLFGLEGRLSRLPDVAVVYGPATVLNEIAIAGNKMLAQVIGTRDAARADAEQQARAAGQPPAGVTRVGDDAVAAFDLRYAPLLVQGMPAGLPTLRNPGFVRNVVYSTEGGGLAPKPQWRFVVPSPNSVSILVRPREQLDQESTDRLVAAVRDTVQAAGLRTTMLTVSGAPAVSASMADEVRREIPLLGACAVVLIAACYLLLPWLGRRRDRILPIAATLIGTAITLAVFGLSGHALSLGAMAFLPILVGIGSDFPAYLARAGRRRRVLVAALASAAGFAALGFSPLPFVRELGLALALGVLLTVGVAWALRHRLVHDTPTEASESPWSPPRSLSRAKRLAIVAIATAVAAAGWIALPRLELEARPDRLAAGLPAATDARHVEQVLGSSGEVRVMLTGPDVLSPAALDWMRQARDATVVRHGDRLRTVLSPPTLLEFLGPAPASDQVAAATALLPRYLLSAVITPDATRAVLSFGIALQDLGSQARLLGDLRAGLPPPPPGYTVALTGLPVVAAKGYELVSANRYLANTAGIVAAGLVLLIGLRRRRDAGLAVAAAVLATGWGLAAVLALGIPLSPLTVALGSLTTAIACEFTVLLADAARNRRPGQRRTVAVAALAATAGYATLMLSRLEIIREFGGLLGLSVLLSLMAAHLVVLVAPPSPASEADRVAARVAARA